MPNRMLEIPFEVADGIVVASLQEQMSYLTKEQAVLEDLFEDGSIEDHQAADYIANKKIMMHMRAVLAYYGAEE